MRYKSDDVVATGINDQASSWKKFEAVKSKIQPQLLTQRTDWDGVMNTWHLMRTRTCIYLVLSQMTSLFVCEGAIGFKK